MPRVIHFDNKSTSQERRKLDKLATMRDIWEKFTEILPKLFNPNENITVDKKISRILWLMFCQTIYTNSCKRHHKKKNKTVILMSTLHRCKEVCELHFSDDAIRRYTEAYNEKTGEKICVSLKGFRLQNFAVPTISTNFPTYLSNSGNPARECPEQRLQRLENEHLQRSIQASIISKEEFEKRKSFTSFPELVECLNAENLRDIWTVVCKNDLVIIMMLDTIKSPVIKASVIINKDLHLTIHIGQTKIDQLGKYKFPVTVHTVIVNEILHELALRIEMKSSRDFPTAFGFIVNLLESMFSDL
ncbi:hypothetical protein TNCV_1770181 [Trichonephila clavipes]|nr:hypothetical protein TNCV_1770181 [Trichonephila clavipes]